MPLQQQPKSSSTSLPAPEELEPHEKEMARKGALLAKVKTLREKLAFNAGMVEGMDPSKVYVWVHQSDNRQIHYQSLGYELCKDTNVKSSWKQLDNTHKRGDLVLYQIDKDLDEAIHLEAQLRGIEGIEGAKEGFKAVAQRENVPIYEPGKK